MQRFIGVFSLACILALPNSLLAQETSQATDRSNPSKIPAVGDQAPDFQLKSLGGETVSLAELRAKHTVVLVVLRGYPGYQCPACTEQAGGFIKLAEEFDRKGAKVAFVYPGQHKSLEKKAEEFLRDMSLPNGFSFLLDPNYDFANAYHLRWKVPNETVYPSTFIVDSSGVVRYTKISQTHGDRSNAKEVLAALP